MNKENREYLRESQENRGGKSSVIFLHEELVVPNNEEINETFGRLVVDVVGRVSFVCRRCLARRSLLVKKSV